MLRIQQPLKSMTALICTLVLLMVTSLWLFNHATASQAETVLSSSSSADETQQDKDLNENNVDQNFSFVDEEEEEEEERDRELERRVHEMEEHQRDLDLQRAELEVRFAQWEMINRVHEVAENRKMAAAYSVMMASEIMERKAAIDFLEDILEKVKDETITRLIHIKLSEMYAGPDHTKKLKQHLQKLILD